MTIVRAVDYERHVIIAPSCLSRPVLRPPLEPFAELVEDGRCSSAVPLAEAGRLPWRVSREGDCETARTAPPVSLTLRFIFPSSSPIILRPDIFSASQPASDSPSLWATPTSRRRPGPMAEIVSPSTVTEASLTRWRTMRTVYGGGGDRRSRGRDRARRPRSLRVGAKEDDASLALVWEVEQAHVQVLDDDPKLPDALYGQVEFVRL